MAEENVVPDELLRSGLEVAWAMAVVGSQLRPPIPAPPALRPLLRFQKLPTKALGTVRRAVEDDEELRARVATVATEEIVGRASWLWLQRPDGWDEELRVLAGAGATGRDAGVDRATVGRLDAAEARVRRLSAELEILRREVGHAQDAREHAEAETARARSRADELERAAAKARARGQRLSDEVDEARRTAADARAEAAALRAEVLAAERTLAERDEIPRSLVERSLPPSVDALTLPAPALDALSGAAAAASALARSLTDLASSLTVGPPAPMPAGLDLPREQHRAVPRRKALRIPRGMHVGSREADTWLLTEADAPVVVDGYNVAKLGWPDQPLDDQRERLLDVLDDLANRHSTSVQVVFDGADVGPLRPARRRHVRVRFSPASVLADDVIRDVVAAHPSDAPIVVVTNDRAIAHDVRAVGANVVSSDGLLAVARR